MHDYNPCFDHLWSSSREFLNGRVYWPDQLVDPADKILVGRIMGILLKSTLFSQYMFCVETVLVVGSLAKLCLCVLIEHRWSTGGPKWLGVVIVMSELATIVLCSVCTSELDHSQQVLAHCM